jgi:hypothetical protein
MHRCHYSGRAVAEFHLSAAATLRLSTCLEPVADPFRCVTASMMTAIVPFLCHDTFAPYRFESGHSPLVLAIFGAPRLTAPCVPCVEWGITARPPPGPALTCVSSFPNFDAIALPPKSGFATPLRIFFFSVM